MTLCIMYNVMYNGQRPVELVLEGHLGEIGLLSRVYVYVYVYMYVHVRSNSSLKGTLVRSVF